MLELVFYKVFLFIFLVDFPVKTFIGMIEFWTRWNRCYEHYMVVFWNIKTEFVWIRNESMESLVWLIVKCHILEFIGEIQTVSVRRAEPNMVRFEIWDLKKYKMVQIPIWLLLFVQMCLSHNVKNVKKYFHNCEFGNSKINSSKDGIMTLSLRIIL